MVIFYLFICSLVWINEAKINTTDLRKNHHLIFSKFEFQHGNFSTHNNSGDANWEIRQLDESMKITKEWKWMQLFQSNEIDNNGLGKLRGEDCTGDDDFFNSTNMTILQDQVGSSSTLNYGKSLSTDLHTLWMIRILNKYITDLRINSDLMSEKTSGRTDVMLWKETNRVNLCSSFFGFKNQHCLILTGCQSLFEQPEVTRKMESLIYNKNSTFESMNEKSVSQILNSQWPRINLSVVYDKNSTESCPINEKLTMLEDKKSERLKKDEVKIMLSPNDTIITKINESLNSRKQKNRRKLHSLNHELSNTIMYNSPKFMLKISTKLNLRHFVGEEFDSQYFTEGWKFSIFDANETDIIRDVKELNFNSAVIKADIEERIIPNKKIEDESESVDCSISQISNVTFPGEIFTPRNLTNFNEDFSTVMVTTKTIENTKMNKQIVDDMAISENIKYDEFQTTKQALAKLNTIKKSSKIDVITNDDTNYTNLTKSMDNQLIRRNALILSTKTPMFLRGEFTIINSAFNSPLIIRVMPSSNGEVSIQMFDAVMRDFVERAEIQMPEVPTVSVEVFIKSLYLAFSQIESFAPGKNRHVELILDNITILYKTYFISI